MPSAPPSIVRLGLTYFGIVFGIGFVLGTIRVLVLVPRLGVRWAELMEMPLMFVAMLLGARYVTRDSVNASRNLTVGIFALALLVGAEIGLTLIVDGRSLGDYIADRDPVSGTVYLGMLGVFAAMPAWLTWRKGT